MKEYVVVQGQVTHFSENVCRHLRHGWECQGGVTVACIPSVQYFQAMTRDLPVQAVPKQANLRAIQ